MLIITSDVDIFGKWNSGFIVIIMNTFDISNNKRKLFVMGYFVTLPTHNSFFYYFSLENSPRSERTGMESGVVLHLRWQKS